ncbi:MAG: hypothetical protein H6825_08225 [Planctomycetes bacterium]|nr:hypothetical protein [Planctomycetota bacterium]
MGDRQRIGTRIGTSALAGILLGSLGAAPLYAKQHTEALPAESTVLLERALGNADLGPRANGQEIFEAVLDSELFLSASVGPFDVSVLQEDGLASREDAQKTLDGVVSALAPAAAVVERRWPAGGAGLVSAARLPVVLASSEPGEGAFGDLVALLDVCERRGFSGWYPANLVDTSANRGAEVVRTWNVQLFNLANPVIAERRDDWIEHGVGYYALAFVANRALRRGAWGMVPPWLANGLIDELDIEAYGEAWVGQESWTVQTPGWFRPGWSGFVPQGQRPPAPLVGPPANLATTVVKSGDAWLSHDASRTRHWTDLVADHKSEAPASFVRTAESESDLPRDRAAGRLLLDLVLESGARDHESFTSLLDAEAVTRLDGMPDSEPLPALFARALGGVPEVERLETLDTRTLLGELGRPDLVALFEQNGAEDALALTDHREQSRWLSHRSYDSKTRGDLFGAFLEIEYLQQMAEWKAMAPRLDAGLRAALAGSKVYPRDTQEMDVAVEAFRMGLHQDPLLVADEQASVPSRSSRRVSTVEGKRRGHR